MRSLQDKNTRIKLKMFSNKKKTAFLYILAVFFISLDRFAKSFFYLNQTSSIKINSLLSLDYAENSFIAFSIPISPLFIKYLSLSLGLFIVYLFVKSIKKNNHILTISLFILILGSFSNIYDRFKLGFVIDYINLKYFTIFNIADSMIFVSVLLLAYFIYTIDKNDKTV